MGDLSSLPLSPQALPELFTQVLHSLFLVWRHSGHYCGAARVAGMVRGVAADAVAAAQKHAAGALRARLRRDAAPCAGTARRSLKHILQLLTTHASL